MPFTSLMNAGLENILNTFLWRDRGLRPARQRLVGHVLRIDIKELSHPLVLIFSESRLDVMGAWEGEANCCVRTRLSVLPLLRDRQQLTSLIRRGDLEVEGDIQVVQNWVTLLDLAEFDPAELLAPWLGDIAAESLSKVVRGSYQFMKNNTSRYQHYLSEALIEEWRVAPGALEVAWFSEETSAIAHDVELLSVRLDKLEGK